uniref:Uncharacterized protein n=1 Tax=Populus alba TaxID=43335 RepID=A0A4U5NSK3_POPAL|nr:hypothetical protein D5086_0000241270 [Populus alba]
MQDLDGTLPKAIEKLPHLKHLVLWANYLSGNIPPEWANTKLETLSVGVNRLTGKIPSYLGRITTLSYLNIQDNMLSGTVPPELGGLVNLENLYLKMQDLDGTLPKAIEKLPHLKHLGLWANYLSGNIPSEWANTKLETLSVGVNNLTGKIPGYLGRITTLSYLSNPESWHLCRNIQDNMFSGTVPPELGGLVNLKNLTLSGNYLTGELPPALTNLTGLKELRLSGNYFTGRIPDFIQSWKQLDTLEIQAGGFTGPIPLNISVLANLTDL